MPEVTDIIFYINLGLAFVSIIELAVVAVIFKKTAWMHSGCLTAIFSLILGIVAFTVQLAMYSFAYKYAMYAVYAALGVLYAGIGTTAVYFIMLSKRPNTGYSLLSGILGFIPPIGTVFMVLLVNRLDTDTRAQSLVYTGYAYTFAALGGLCGKFKLEFIDGGSVDEGLDELIGHEIKEKLAKLKKNLKTIEGKFEYGAALLNYVPKKQRKGLKLIREAAKANHTPALFNLGYCYEMGIRVKRDLKRARELYDRAMELGDKEAELRIACVEIALGRPKEGIKIFEERANKSDKNAMYNLALATELGVGVEKDMDKAIKMYRDCGAHVTAQRRLFVLAAERINADRGDGLFDKVMGLSYNGDFKLMMEGVKLVSEKRASDAAAAFLNAVKSRGKWEGIARCLVGALYVDNGALESDRRNGAAYIKSAFDYTTVAHDVYRTLPSEITATKKRK